MTMCSKDTILRRLKVETDQLLIGRVEAAVKQLPDIYFITWHARLANLVLLGYDNNSKLIYSLTIKDILEDE